MCAFAGAWWLTGNSFFALKKHLLRHIYFRKRFHHPPSLASRTPLRSLSTTSYPPAAAASARDKKGRMLTVEGNQGVPCSFALPQCRCQQNPSLRLYACARAVPAAGGLQSVLRAIPVRLTYPPSKGFTDEIHGRTPGRRARESPGFSMRSSTPAAASAPLRSLPRGLLARRCEWAQCVGRTRPAGRWQRLLLLLRGIPLQRPAL